MTKSEFRRKMIISNLTRILLAGLKYMIAGTLTLGMLVVSVFGFCLVSKDGGYVAVFDFIVSCFLLAASVASIYLLGIPRKRRGGKYVEKQ